MIKFFNGSDLEKPSVEKITVHYTQQADCCQNPDEYQTIVLTTEDGGGGPFIRISVPDNGFWSIDSEEDLVNIIKDFKERINYEDSCN